jgi:hypothetical protein
VTDPSIPAVAAQARQVTGTCRAALLAKPPRFHTCSVGWIPPWASVARGEDIRARRGGPRHLPPPPGPAVPVRGVQRGGQPRLSIVDADLHLGDPGATRPRPALEEHPAGAHDPGPGHEVREVGRDHQRTGRDPGHRVTGLVGVAAHAIGDGLLETGERLGDDVDPAQPLHVGHAVPAGRDQPHGIAVLRRQRRATHRVRRQHVLLAGLGERQAALIVLLDPALHTVIGAGEHDVDRGGIHLRKREDVPQRHARPLGGADRLDQPGLADRPGVQAGAPVAGAGRAAEIAQHRCLPVEVSRP